MAALGEEHLQYHKVPLLDYPVFPAPSYTLSLAVKIAELTRELGLEVIHVHYAVPHAVSAYLARQMLTPDRVALVTTLHGTDITLVGQNPAFHAAVRFAIDHSDRVTAVSGWLRDQTVEKLGVERPIDVVPNFVDAEIFRRETTGCTQRRFLRPGQKIVLHVSNFRPVKRPEDVVRVFAAIREQVNARLLLVGDGPDRPDVEDRARELGVLSQTAFLGPHPSTECFFAVADLFLLTSKNESFGLAALEAMSAEVPVIAYDSGGLGELIRDGETGFLVPLGDVEAMAARAVEVLNDPERAAAMGARARQIVCNQYLPEQVVPRYEAIYQAALEAH
jgi:N-acetyl-alpha-D-glucosaminyl L-malate synthase BshA